MKPSIAKNALKKFFKARLPVLLVGPPGVAKTSIVRQAAEELEMKLHTFYPVISDPTDFKGMPGIINGKAEFMLFGESRKIVEETEPCVAFLDDVGQAPAQVQGAIMNWILGRQAGEHKIPDNVTFVAATNRKQDKAAVSGILEPVKSRFSSILNLEADLDDWTAWALNNYMPPELIGFMHHRPDLLCAFVPTAEIKNSPNPRTWENVGNNMNAGFDPRDPAFLDVMAGAVGEGAAIELKAFLDIGTKLPNLDKCLEHPDIMQDYRAKEAGPDVMWMVAAGLAARVTEKTGSNYYTLLHKLPAEYSTFSLKMAISKVPELMEDKANFHKWVDKNQMIWS